jgi:anthranilate/para-aminobenzoate synthase component II
MEVGIVNMYGTNYECHYLINAILSLNIIPHVIDGFNTSEQYVYNYIENSQIKHWIFSGSAHDPTLHDAKKVPIGLLNLNDKQFMMLCYSMESILKQLNCHISKRKSIKKELFKLQVPNYPIFQGLKNPLVLRRNHRWYFSRKAIKEPISLIASYEDEVMIAAYSNMFLLQFHPEKTPDGKQLIQRWLELSN